MGAYGLLKPKRPVPARSIERIIAPDGGRAVVFLGTAVSANQPRSQSPAAARPRREAGAEPPNCAWREAVPLAAATSAQALASSAYKNCESCLRAPRPSEHHQRSTPRRTFSQDALCDLRRRVHD